MRKTTCIIGFEYADGTCKTIHCQYDGYLEHTGKLLLESYKAVEKVHDLIILGDIIMLQSTPKETESYHCDYDEEWETCCPSYFDSFEEMAQWHTKDIVYFMLKNKTWICQINGKSLMQGYTLKRAIVMLNTDMDS